MFIIKGRVISKKNSKRLFRRGARVVLLPSVAYSLFLRDALFQIRSQRTKDNPLAWKGTVAITLEFQLKGKLDIDIDNAITSVFDVLQDAGVIEDDKLVVALSSTKCGGFKEFQTNITVQRVDIVR